MLHVELADPDRAGPSDDDSGRCRERRASRRAALTDQSRVAITETPAAFPATGEYEGLDARDSLPPLLRPEVAMDWESWWEFERHGVNLIAQAPSAPRALGQLNAVIETIRPWRPGHGSFIARVRSAFDHEPEEPEEPAEPEDPAMLRFLCAHAFANWTAHLGLGLRT